MSLLILERLPAPTGYHMPPKWRVRCPDCKDEYVVRAWASDVKRRKTYVSCRLEIARAAKKAKAGK